MRALCHDPSSEKRLECLRRDVCWCRRWRDERLAKQEAWNCNAVMESGTTKAPPSTLRPKQSAILPPLASHARRGPAPNQHSTELSNLKATPAQQQRSPMAASRLLLALYITCLVCMVR